MNSTFSASPTSTMRLDRPTDWPVPPFASSDPWDCDDDATTPVRIETQRGIAVEGQMLAFDTERESMIFRFDEGGAALRVQFRRFRRMTLLAPLADHAAGAAARIRFASELRKYKIALTGEGKLSGRTAGHVETRAGLFLYTPDEDESTLQRSFVPACAYTRCVLGPSVEEDASIRWLSTPRALTAALDEPIERRKTMPIGEAIFDLGVISGRQLAMALTAQGVERKVQLGEMLVARGLLSRADLRTALGHKMGYPLVNVLGFALDFEALDKLPIDAALACNALPLLSRGLQLVVAVDNLARVAQLAALPVLAGLKIVPMLARQSHIESALVTAYQEHVQGSQSAPRQAWRLTAPMAA